MCNWVLLQIGCFVYTASLGLGCVSRALPDRPQTDMVETLRSIMLTDYQKVVFTFGTRGELIPGYQSGIDFGRILDFYESDLILQHLALPNDQQEKLLRHVSTWRYELEELTEDFDQHIVAPAELVDHISSIDDKFYSRIKTVLLPHQLDALEALQLRFIINTYGFKAFVDNEFLRNESEMSDLELARIRAAGRRIRRDVETKASQVRAAILESVSEGLDEKKRTGFLSKWRPLFVDKPDAQLELALCQLENFEQVDLGASEPLRQLVSLPKRVF